MGMGLVLDVESESIEQYPDDMPLCGEAIVGDSYRSDGGENEPIYSFSSLELAGTLLAVALGTLIISFGTIFAYITWSRKNGDNLPLAQETEMTDSPLQEGGKI